MIVFANYLKWDWRKQIDFRVRQLRFLEPWLGFGCRCEIVHDVIRWPSRKSGFKRRAGYGVGQPASLFNRSLRKARCSWTTPILNRKRRTVRKKDRLVELESSYPELSRRILYVHSDVHLEQKYTI